MTTQLPEIRTPWLVCIGFVVLFLVPYSIVGHLSFPRYVIPFLFGEERIPFLPWTFCIYLSVFLQAVFAIRFGSRRFLKPAMQFAFALLFTAIVFFILWPIKYPRELYPTTDASILFFRLIDATGNSFPSIHVAMAIFLAGCYSFFEKSRVRMTLMWLWTSVIVVSVLTTKQHYLIDVFGGIALAVFYLFFARRRFRQIGPV